MSPTPVPPGASSSAATGGDGRSRSRSGRRRSSPRRASSSRPRESSRSVWADQPADDETNPHLVVADGIAVAGRAAGPRRPPRARRRRTRRARQAPSTYRSRPIQRRPSCSGSSELANDIELLVAEAAADDSPVQVVPWPATMSATAAMALQEDPAEFAQDLARPMPRQPSGAARFGTRFHAWVEAHFGQQTLLDPTELPGRGDVGLEYRRRARADQAAFRPAPTPT